MATKAKANHYGKNLTVEVKDGRLVIEIGVNTLAHAISYADWANPFDDERNDYVRTFAIADAEKFARDVMHAMLKEEEDGSSPLSDFLDESSEAAVNDGSEACEFDQVIEHGETAKCETWAKRKGRAR